MLAVYSSIVQSMVVVQVLRTDERIHRSYELTTIYVLFDLNNVFINRLCAFDILKNSLICSACQFNNESYVHTQSVNVYPENIKDISDLLNKSLMSPITKLCVVCSINTLHYEYNSLISHHNYFIIVVNHFTFNTQARKDKTSVIINRKFKHNSIDYDLVVSILHHGDSLNSGHCTSKIYYKDAAFHFNDEHITKEGLNEETSIEIYIAFYKSSV